MKKVLLLLVIGLPTLFFLPGTAEAGGYTYRHGYYYSGGHGYSKYYQPGYYGYSGYYHQPYYFYQRDYSAPAYEPTANTPAVPEYGPGWKEKSVTFLKAREDHEAYNKFLESMGYKGQTFGNGLYGVQAYAGYRPYVNTGATLYGYSPYSVKTVMESYGGLDVNTGFASATRLVAGGQAVASDAMKDLMGVLAEGGRQNAGVARILAEGAARRSIQESSRLSPSSTTTTEVTGSATTVTPIVGGAAPATMPPAGNGSADTPERKAASAAFFKEVGSPMCGKCHSGSDPKGKFNIAAYPGMLDKKKVYERLLTDDPKLQMPPPEEPQLTVVQHKRFLRW